MGYNTTVFILNDQLSIIKADPELFVNELIRAINNTDSPNKPQSILGQTTVMPSMHADVARVYYTARNSIVDISSYPNEKAEPHYKKFWTECSKDAMRYIKLATKYFQEQEIKVKI